jgi:hypothetical protein
MAKITLETGVTASGLVDETLVHKEYTFTVPGVTAAELEAAAATFHAPGADPAAGVLLSASESQTVFVEKFNEYAKVTVTD